MIHFRKKYYINIINIYIRKLYFYFVICTYVYNTIMYIVHIMTLSLHERFVLVQWGWSFMLSCRLHINLRSNHFTLTAPNGSEEMWKWRRSLVLWTYLRKKLCDWLRQRFRSIERGIFSTKVIGWGSQASIHLRRPHRGQMRFYSMMLCYIVR